MKIGFIKCKNESLVGLVPSTVSKFVQQKIEVQIEKGAGELSGYHDSDYSDAGASLSSRGDVLKTSDLIVTCSSIEREDLALIGENAYVIGKFGSDNSLKEQIKNEKVKAFTLDLLPRSTIAQSMDVLSSLASLSGYKAALTGADNFPGYFPMMTTSAGTIPPAKVLVLGAGVAGLQAIATAKRLGAVVQAFDVRSSVKEEVESLGAKFIEVEGSSEDDSAGGYAVQQTEAYIQKQKELIHQTAVKSDVVITTAAIPGKKAPLLLEKQTVAAMKAGSVIVDLAADSGGNCELTKNAETVDADGVKIVGDSKLYNQMAKQGSLVYSNNISNFVKFVFKEGLANIPFDNDIVSNTLIATDK